MPRHPFAAALAIVLPLAFFLAAVPSAAEEPVDWEVVTKIRDEGLHHSQVMETLEHLTEVIGPRLTGSPGMKEANVWTKQKLDEWGLENAHLEPFEFGRGWSFSRTSVHLLEPREMPLQALPKAWTPGTDGPVRGGAVKVKLESEKDLEKWKGKLRGKVLFVDDAREPLDADEPVVQRHSDEDLSELFEFEVPDGERGAWRERARKRFALRDKLHDFLVEEGVLAMVEVSSRDGGLLRVGGGGAREVGKNPGVLALTLAAEQYNWLVRLLDKAEKEAEGKEAEDAEDEDGEDEGSDDDEGGDQAEGAGEAEGDDEPEPEPVVVLEIDVSSRFHDDDVMAYNTIAEIPGTGDGLVMVGAHLDSWHTGTGATDNAAGCAVAMEAVRILKALGVEPKRTIRIGLWGGEEQGLLGSRHHVGEHFGKLPVADDPEQEELPFYLRDVVGEVETLPAHDTFSAYFNLDNGSGRIRGIYTQENLGVAPIFAAWLEPFNDLGAETVTHRNTRGTDHMSYDRVGLPGFQFIQDGLDYRSRTHHTAADTLDHVVREDLVQASVIMASFLYHAAMRDEPLPRKPMPRYEPSEEH